MMPLAELINYPHGTVDLSYHHTMIEHNLSPPPFDATSTKMIDYILDYWIPWYHIHFDIPTEVQLYNLKQSVSKNKLWLMCIITSLTCTCVKSLTKATFVLPLNKQD